MRCELVGYRRSRQVTAGARFKTSDWRGPAQRTMDRGRFIADSRIPDQAISKSVNIRPYYGIRVFIIPLLDLITAFRSVS